MIRIKIGVDAVPLSSLCGGIGYFIFYLLDACVQLHPDWTFYLYAFSSEGDIAHFKRYPHVVIRPLPALKISHSLWSQTTLSLALCKDQIDVFWGTTQSIPLLCRKKMKTILLLHDFVFHYFPKTVSTVKCAFLQSFTRAMVAKADCLFSNSQGTADKLFLLYGKRADLLIQPCLKSTISYKEKTEAEGCLSIFGLEYKHYFLTIGTIEPRKNFTGLLDAYLHLLKQHPTLPPLAIVGGGGWKNAEILDKLKCAQRQFPDKIKCLGRVSDEALSSLLSGARYYLCFSLYEGYGMPLAEARYCRTPVICFDQPEMREAAENDGIFLPQSGFEDILAAHLLNTKPPTPAPCTYLANEEKGRFFSQAILDLIHE